MMNTKPSLSFWQIFNMNVGFLGIQFSFGLQQTAVNPIFSFLGAHHEDLPLLNLAGPITGLIIQPIIGAISDKTWSPRYGRRKPFFMIGALIGSLCLLAFPFSPSLWFAVGLLWILDVGNNMAMEPYRAFVGDKLPNNQLSFGYQMQSLFVGAGIVLANASIFIFQDWFAGSESIESTVNTIPKWLYYSFFLGAILSVATITWSVLKTPEIPPSESELKEIEKHNILPILKRIKTPFFEITNAIKDMPKFMWKLSGVYLFQWYALFIYWQFISPMFQESMGFDKSEALSQAAKMNTTYNISTIIFALALVPLALKWGGKKVYVTSLFLTGIATISIPFFEDSVMVLIPMVLFGIGWAAMMGIPYSMVSKIVPQERRGVYMGIVNMMIVIPMGIQTISFGPIVKNLLNNSAVNAILLGGIFFMIAGLLALRIQEPKG
ncbi:MAG: SLC45 family MFS transporter [Flavobacteriia bacterium]|nr:SLC45 family MFS transporter [Flavobacteriia bacterium]OIP48160.1 MAG: MFS transporter [Flavobacteriaceae bacterium CG2_30_31_66]PIV97866.1 MAG: MFS transporter [Flavobacteriaceae bacterium CG17_big_fil_post_rev_8_21_14_2_50_31_13]PIY14607.1 MAG: MFS transporter [Flavobacteriaceae bacterium CG_4_10_14_3_um_filter_31_253]PIZ10874.1 MAG: MFS transporter [Flavobacteriaceae bacterium CG_4_10_14_0_8_um_filter_31_99]PJC08681.1 MAG: MFS transporter [Flavobacteriaceae bacterium CG_4_9_14_0_8_um_fil